MTQADIILPIQPDRTLPEVRRVTLSDLGASLRAGWQDFVAMPSHLVFLGAIYPLVGLLLFAATSAYDLFALLYPLAAGFAIVGPIAALGLYEISRRRELDADPSLRHAFDVIHSPSLGPIVALGLGLVVLFGIWIAVAQAIYTANFGYAPITSVAAFAERVMTTPEGRSLIVTGNIVGFLFALLAASISVIAFPLLLDRNVGLSAAVVTSIKVVLKNPVTMAAWFLIVALLLLVGSVPALVGLAIVLPLLGHATWHLYRKAVEPDAGQRPAYQQRTPRGRRHAADFPVSLFVPTRVPERDENRSPPV